MDTLHVVTQMIWATLGAWRSEAWVRYVQSEVNQGVLASDDVLLVGQERPRDHGEVLEAELQPRLVMLTHLLDHRLNVAQAIAK